MKSTVSEKVTGAQYISHDCLVCGEDNPLGLHGHFFMLENGEVVGEFDVKPHHQSYPGRTHGGIICAILDETMARASTKAEDAIVYSVTTNLSITYRKPVPYDKPVRCIARVDRDRRRLYEASGEIVDEEGNVLASGKGTFAVFSSEQIVTSVGEEYDERAEMFPDPIELPERIEIG